MTVTWSRTPALAWSELARREADAIESEVVQFADSLTDQITAWMRQEARWNDVTGEARAGLYSDVIHTARQSVAILMSYGPTTFYDVYLEASPRTSLLGDVVDYWAPVIYRGAQEIARRHGRG